jgi:two-component system, NarL family, invasion response regulator UvrY
MGETSAYPRTRLLVVDDHAVARASLAEAVAVMGDCEVIGEAATASAALELIKDQHCDLVLLDISLPDGSVVDTMRALREVHPQIAILIVSMHPEEQYAANLIRAGADGYFAKGQEAAELRRAIRAVAGGVQYMSPAVSASLAAVDARPRPLPPRELLTPREYEVFVGLGAGKSVAEIADQMSVSAHSVGEYAMRIREKLHLSTDGDASADDAGVVNRLQHAGEPSG